MQLPRRGAGRASEPRAGGRPRADETPDRPGPGSWLLLIELDPRSEGDLSSQNRSRGSFSPAASREQVISTITPFPPAPQKPTSIERPVATRPTTALVRYVVPVAAIHLLGFLCLVPAFFSWTGVVICLIGVHLFGQAITMGYHRLLTHRSFETRLWFEHLLVLLAMCSFEDTPARWVATHRVHHAHSDEQEDPHSPLVSAFWGHMGWLLVFNRALHTAGSYEKYARDVLRDPFYMWLERRSWRIAVIYTIHAILFFVVAFGIGSAIWGVTEGLWFGASIVVWGVIVRTLLVWHITWSVNSLAHLFGYRNHDTNEESRNNWFVALVSAGEGWHNNHHHDPKCCTVSHRWWELDVTHLEVRLLRRLGIVTSIVPRREERARLAMEKVKKRA
ncbi:MAG: hypothetical protein CMJ54_06025 [Planctomycetaceae bacterium]|nr:hypothetical protein [Planctomycetaceae bacterium]